MAHLPPSPLALRYLRSPLSSRTRKPTQTTTLKRRKRIRGAKRIRKTKSESEKGTAKSSKSKPPRRRVRKIKRKSGAKRTNPTNK
jgi:hypothetical protein